CTVTASFALSAAAATHICPLSLHDALPISSSALSFSGPPVTSIVTASGTTSTTCARNRLTISSTPERDAASARTLTSRSSRWTEPFSSSSTILITLTSLLSCLVTCSSGRASTSTTTVIREISGISVGPTASEWMLNERRANRPATRVSTPGLFSTRTDSVCRVMLHLLPGGRAGRGRRGRAASVLPVPRGRDAACVLDLVVAHARGDHGPHHRVARDGEVHDDGLV